MGIVCERIALNEGDTLLDIGCGWGTLAKFASINGLDLATSALLPLRAPLV